MTRRLFASTGGTDEHLEPVTAVEGTALHTPAAEEAGDPALDAGAEALALLEPAALLIGGARGRLGAPALGNTLGGAPGGLTVGQGGGTGEPAVGRVEGRGGPQQVLMTR